MKVCISAGCRYGVVDPKYRMNGVCFVHNQIPNSPMQDILGSEITVGARIAYPQQRGHRTNLVLARVVTVRSVTLTVRPEGKDRLVTLQKPIGRVVIV